MSDKYHKQLEEYYERVVGVYGSSYTGIGRYRSNHFRLEILVDLIQKITSKPSKILDAGCGDARPLIELLKRGFDICGYDASDAMLKVGKDALRLIQEDENRIWKGNIYDSQGPADTYDSIVCMGVIQNLPDHPSIFSEFQRVLKPGGRLFVNTDNNLFSLFSMNEHSLNYLTKLFADIGVPDKVSNKVIDQVAEWNHVENITKQKKTFEGSDIDRTDVNLASYNPLNVHDEFRQMGFEVEEIRFYHYHPLPPRFEVEYPELFKELAESLETVEYDWRGGILCNCMVVQAQLIT